MYINTSKKTVAIAKGIALYAAYQDLPVVHDPNSQVLKDWDAWRATHPVHWITFVEKAQYDLFDRVNGLL